LKANWASALFPSRRRALVESASNPRQDIALGYWREVFDDGPAVLQALLEKFAANVDVPCSAVFGDDVEPDYRAWLRPFVPQCNVVSFPQSGHFPHLVEIDRFAEEIRAVAKAGRAVAKPAGLSSPDSAPTWPHVKTAITMKIALFPLAVALVSFPLHAGAMTQPPAGGANQPEAGPDPAVERLAPLPIVGRDAELAHLQRIWQRAARGSGALVLVNGEGGIGKSRLIGELALAAEGQGARILTGTTSFPESRPYQALIEAIRGHCRCWRRSPSNGCGRAHGPPNCARERLTERF
jgi:hypothetical protein